jgi:TolB-like protein
MNAHRWQRVDEIYHAALERRAGDRPAFLDSACADDGDLRTEVESLLGWETDAETFLERSALEESVRQLVNEYESLIGGQLGGFRVLSLLGSGGMGDVYRASDVRLGRDVALKVCAVHVAGDPAYARRFEKEARAASTLNHPNIVTIYGVGEDADVAYIAMELVEGRTLREVLSASQLDLAVAIDVAVQLAEALAAAHAHGIVHRDLKPDNVMITPGTRVKVLDFGIAKRADEAAAFQSVAATDAWDRSMETSAGTILGTAGYMSPEQARGRPADHRSDQFSFGAILYELLSGRPAFEVDSKAATIAAVTSSEPAAFDSVRPNLPAALRAVVTRCLAKDPAGRYGNTQDLASELRDIKGRHALDHTRRRITRRAVMAGGAAAAAVIATALAAWQFWPMAVPRRVMVLPFQNLTGDSDLDYFSEGLTETVIRRLSWLPVEVTPLSALFSIEQPVANAREAGRRLSADAVLEGGITRQAGRLRVAAALFDVATGATLWGDTFDVPTADVRSVPDQIAGAIVQDGIRLRLSRDEQRRFARPFTISAEAYDLYLRALHEHRSESEDGYLSARRLLQQAIDLDSGFALAHAALAATFAVTAIDGIERPTEAWPASSQHVRRALDLDPDLVEAHAENASRLFFFDRDWDGAMREWRRAVRDGDRVLKTDVLSAYPLALWAIGRRAEALEQVRAARAIDPLSLVLARTEADLLLYEGELDAAARLYETMIGQAPADARAYFGLAETRRLQGRWGEAIALRLRGHEAAGDDLVGEAAAGPGDRESYRRMDEALARVHLSRLVARAGAGAYVSPLDFARVYAQLGQHDRAFSFFPEAHNDRAAGLVFLEVDPAWDRVRDDPRFAEAVRKVGLP